MEIKNKNLSTSDINVKLTTLKNNDKKLKFFQCTFSGDVDIREFNDIEYIEIEKCTFDKGLLLAKLSNLKKVDILYSTFKGRFDCAALPIEKLSFQYNLFIDNVTFIRSECLQIINFKYCIFKEKVIFANNEIKIIDFEGTTFNNGLDYINDETSKVKNKILKLEHLANRETSRIFKDSYEKQNNIIEANKFYAIEMEKREKELEEDRKKGKNFFEWLVFKVHGLASNHSQDWLLVLFWIFSFTFSFVIQHYVNCYFLTSTLEYILVDIFIFLGFIHGSYLIIEYEKINKFWYVGVFYFIYGFFTKDWMLKTFSNQLNPFSIMTGKEHLTFGGLIYKVIIAYLIYQLIISIRQNTRRK